MAAGIVLVLWQGGEKVITGAWTLGAFVTYLDLFLRFTGRGFRVPQLVNSVQAGGAAYARLAPLLAAALPARGEHRFASFRAGYLAGTTPRSTLTEPSSRAERGLAVSLHNVSFSHGNADAAVTALNQVSLEISAGAFVAVTGPVGSGKSALAKALLGACTRSPAVPSPWTATRPHGIAGTSATCRRSPSCSRARCERTSPWDVSRPTSPR